MTLPPERAGSAAPDEPGDTTTDGGEDDRPVADADPMLEGKPVLDWTKDDWARWVEGAPPIVPAVPEPADPGAAEVALPLDPAPAHEPGAVRWQGDPVGPVADVELDEPAPPPPVEDWVPEDLIVDVGLPEEEELGVAGDGAEEAAGWPRYDHADDVVSGAQAPLDQVDSEVFTEPDHVVAEADTPPAPGTPVAELAEADAVPPPGAPATHLAEDQPVDEHAWAFGPDRPWWEPPVAPAPPPPRPFAPARAADVADASEATIVPPPFQARPLVEPPAEPRPTTVERRPAPRQARQRRAALERAPHRVRSALGLLAVSVVVGLVLAALITVAVFAIGVALRRAVG